MPAQIWFKVGLLGIPLLFALLAWIGYMAVEPYARRMWPEAMVSWQRLLNGRLRDPLIGRDLMLGILAGSAVGLLDVFARTYEVDPNYGRGVMASVSEIPFYLFVTCFLALLNLATLSALTGLFRRRWLGMLATGMILVGSTLGPNLWYVAFGFVIASAMLLIVTRVGLLALAAFILAEWTDWPPLVFSQWYAGLALIPVLARLALLIYAFWVSLGGQPMLGSASIEE